MQKLHLYQGLSQKLSPQQIQLIKLLQLPIDELHERIEEELEDNIALEKATESEEHDPTLNPSSEYDLEEGEEAGETYQELDFESEPSFEEANFSEYTSDEDFAGYKMEGDGSYGSDEDFDLPVASYTTLQDSLLEQLDFLNLSPKEYSIGKYIIGSLEPDGYLRRGIDVLVNDLAFYAGVEAQPTEVEEVLHKIHQFEPSGIAARSLQECLLIQLRQKDQNSADVKTAILVLQECFEEFTKKHYQKITKKMSLSEDQLRQAISLITKLNPKPGNSESNYNKSQTITPDFFILENENGDLYVKLNTRNEPELRVSSSILEVFQSYEKSRRKDKKLRETAQYYKQKLDSARWFIDAIKQRHETLLKTMTAILEYQYDFFLTEDETKLRPMILKDVAMRIGMDISTVSRVASSKTVQTASGTYPLKFFFSESIATDTGEDVSSKEVKFILKEIIENEDKMHPYSDDSLEIMLKDKGYNIARRTVAKYREQLGIAVARLRKEL
jgi:RNA polymerase sigma-54 factor